MRLAGVGQRMLTAILLPHAWLNHDQYLALQGMISKLFTWVSSGVTAAQY